MRVTTVLLLIVSVSGAIVTGLSGESRAAAAEGCLPTNGLMNLNDADDLLRGVVRLSSGTTVDLGSGDIDWDRRSLSSRRARDLYSLKWVEELVREHRRTGDGAYLQRAVEIVEDFATDHPVGGGPDAEDAWYPMHAGQRATAIVPPAPAGSMGG